MAFFHIPHPAVVLSNIRVNDIWLLLSVGAVYELGCRLYVLFLVKMKPDALLKKEQYLKQLTMRTNNARKLGPPAFVETSKLERQVLSLEKELNTIYEQRKRYASLLLQGEPIFHCTLLTCRVVVGLRIKWRNSCYDMEICK
jgi:hypothetical protein